MSFGCIPDNDAECVARDRAQRPVEHLVGSTASLPLVADLRAFARAVLDQGPTNSCVAQSLALAMFVAGRGQIPWLAILWLYALARLKRTPGKLLDEGSIIRLMCEGAAEHGAIAADRWPFEPERVNDFPPLDAHVAAKDALFHGYYRLDDGDIPTRARRAIAQGHAVLVAYGVHENFARWKKGDGVYDKPSGAWRGNHMSTLLAYKQGLFLLRNSWGFQWGDDGECWVTEAFVSEQCFEQTVVTAGPVTR